MDLSKKLLTLLAIFCVIASAGVVCAEDGDGYAGSNYVDDGGWAGSQYEDGGYAGSQYQDDGGWAGSQYDESVENAAAGESADVSSNSSHAMLATGSPILALLAVGAVLGGAAVIARKK